MKVFYSTGPGDTVKAHEYWKKGIPHPGQFSLTFSGQIEDFCKNNKAELYAVSYHSEVKEINDGAVKIKHIPKPWPNAGGLRYHLREIYYGLMLVSKVIKYRPDIFIYEQGATYTFILLLLKLLPTKIIIVLHCTLWPKGAMPTKTIHKLILWLDKFFYMKGAHSIIGVSPECCRQVRELTKNRSKPLYQIRAQYIENIFDNIVPIPRKKNDVFEILFVGRIVENKGVFDIVSMAELLEQQMPDRVHWHICGQGSDFDKLKKVCEDKNMQSHITLHGWVDPKDILKLYNKIHATIVPTKDTFAEGLAMVAAESVLCGRPVITNPVVPAGEILGDAAIIAETNNVASYVGHIKKLIDDEAWYNEKVKACSKAGKQFLDREQGLTAVLEKVIIQHRKG